MIPLSSKDRHVVEAEGHFYSFRYLLGSMQKDFEDLNKKIVRASKDCGKLIRELDALKNDEEVGEEREAEFERLQGLLQELRLQQVVLFLEKIDEVFIDTDRLKEMFTPGGQRELYSFTSEQFPYIVGTDKTTVKNLLGQHSLVSEPKQGSSDARDATQPRENGEVA